MKKRVAFTLAETLITLGIIGVVAAITMPTLIANYKAKQTATQLKTVYSILDNAIRMAEVNDGFVSEWGLTGLNEETSTIVYEKLKPYLKIVKACGVDDSAGECIYSGYYKRLNGTNHANYAIKEPYNTYKIKLSNGQTVFWHGSGENICFFVDLNGTKGPNQFGRDLFSFRYYTNSKKLLSGGTPINPSNSNYETDCLAENAIGHGCAYYVMTYEKMDY